MFIVCRCRRPATTAVSFFHFFSIGDFHSDWPTSRSPQFGSSSSPGSDASFSAACVNHSHARAWLFSGRACTPVFFINGQSVIITPPDYYCFYKMMGSLKRQNGIWDVVFRPSLLVLSSGDEGFIYMMLLLACRAARRLPLVSRSIWNQLMYVIWMLLIVNKGPV